MPVRTGGDAGTDLLDQITGLTGLGWTTAVLGYLGTVMGYGNGVVSRLVAEPQSLLVLGGGFFVVTLGLDRVRDRVEGTDGEGSAPDRR